MRFVAIDVETANPNMDSVCQIGLVEFEGKREVAAEVVLIDPQTWFDPRNISIHGIDEVAVRGAKTFHEIYGWLDHWTRDRVVVCHTHFDRVSLLRACSRQGKPELGCTWLDTARVARQSWAEFASRGFGLANLANHFDIAFQHHDALHDARTAGLILLRAIEDSQKSLDEWLSAAYRPLSLGQSVQRVGDGDGAFTGELIVFTGALQIRRREAADRAAEAGANVQAGITKETTILVVGDQDIERLAGKNKSNKHLKAEKLIAQGQPIRIIGETDFMTLSSVTS
jgi:DNA polymerase-3 subunit epsilon